MMAARGVDVELGIAADMAGPQLVGAQVVLDHRRPRHAEQGEQQGGGKAGAVLAAVQWEHQRRCVPSLKVRTGGEARRAAARIVAVVVGRNCISEMRIALAVSHGVADLVADAGLDMGAATRQSTPSMLCGVSAAAHRRADGRIAAPRRGSSRSVLARRWSGARPVGCALIGPSAVRASGRDAAQHRRRRLPASSAPISSPASATRSAARADGSANPHLMMQFLTDHTATIRAAARRAPHPVRDLERRHAPAAGVPLHRRKDRTGFASALLLTLLGVPWPTVIETTCAPTSCGPAMSAAIRARHRHPRRHHRGAHSLSRAAFEVVRVDSADRKPSPTGHWGSPAAASAESGIAGG